MTTEILTNLSNLMLTVESASDTTSSAANGTTGGCGSMGSILIIYAVLFGLLYLFMIRPQNKKRKAEEEMKKNIEVGDDITTIGGICGRVVSIKDDDALVIETGAEKNKIKIMRWGVLQNNTIKEAAETEEAAAGKKKKGLFGFLKK